MKLRLLCTPSTKGSGSLRLLAQNLTNKLGYKVWRSTLSKPNRIHLKYGHSIDKLTQYQWFKQHGIPALDFTTNRDEAMQWVAQGNTVFGRKYLNSSCGKGIVIYEPGSTPSPEHCPVYTLYKKKKREFRVHVFKDKVVAVVEKRKKTGFEGQRESKIRNLANGYVFCQSVENPPEGLHELALAASKCSPSDFRGVDIGYNERNNELFVIEVNSAPGIQGSNINHYVSTICSV